MPGMLSRGAVHKLGSPAALFLVGVGGVLACLLVSAAAAEDWPRWRGPRGDGTWQGPNIATHWPAELPVRWKRSVHPGYAGVVVAGDRLLTMDHPSDPESERILCLSAETGESLWTHAYPVTYGDLDYGNGPRAAPTVHGDRVYTLGAMGHLHCLDLATGEVLWAHDLVQTERAEIPTWGLAASPVVWRDLVVVHAGGRPNGCLIAFDGVTGRVVWRAGDDPAGYATPILIDSPAGEQLICWTPLHVVGLRPATGEVLWKIPYEVTYGVSIATPIYQQGLVFVAGYWEGSKAIRLTPAGTAELVWEDRKLLRGLMSQPLYRDGYVYLLDKHHGLTCFELESGEVAWNDARHQLIARDRNPQASIVWTGTGNRALLLNAEGDLIHAELTPSGFQELGRASVIGSTWAHPAFAGQMVYARSDEELVAVELPTE